MDLVIFMISYCLFYLGMWKMVGFAINLRYASVDLQGYKRKYVLKNLVKSSVLFVWSPAALHIIKDTLIHGIWDNDFLHVVGSFYALTDFMSLVMVRGLPSATVVHHVCVSVLGASN